MRRAALAALLLARSAASPGVGPRVALVVDAGSTGSRLHVVQWTPGHGDDLPRLRSTAKMKVYPGLSSFADAPSEAATTLSPLIEYAHNHVPPAERSSTPLTLYGTAGMRALPAAAQERIYTSVREDFEEAGYNVGAVRTISGEEEGKLGWLALKWLAQGTEAGQHGLGALDLGGGSTQIAYSSSASVVQSSKVRSVSYTGFGNRAALARVEALILARGTSAEDGRWNQPCYFRGYNYTSATSRTRFIGTSEPEECAKLVSELFLPSASPRFERREAPPPDVAFYGLGACAVANQTAERNEACDTSCEIPARRASLTSLQVLLHHELHQLQTASPEHATPQPCNRERVCAAPLPARMARSRIG